MVRRHQAFSNETSFHCLYRPVVPPCPASTSILAMTSTPAACSRAIHLSGSTTSTRVSFIDVVIRIFGKWATRGSSGDSGAFSYGVYDFMYR